MSNPKDLNDFQQNYCTTLVPESNSNSFFVKVPVANYNELSIIKTNLLTAIKLIADSNEVNESTSKGDVTYSIGTLVKLLHSFGMEEECEGLSSLFISNKT